MACGVCGSDIVEWYRLPRAPLVQGHEIGAEVVKVGEGVRAFAPGDRVFIAPKVACLTCRYCREGHHPQCTEVKGRLPGGFAEYVLVPRDLVERGIYRLPDSMSHEVATFIEPLGCVVRAQRLAGVHEGQTVLVLGSGMSGVLNVRLAKSCGATVIATDVSDRRLEFARRSGADLVLHASADVPERIVREFGRKADVVVVTTSALPAFDQAWRAVDSGGAVVLFAVPGPEKQVVVPVNDFWRREIRILTSYYCGPTDLTQAMSLIQNRQVAVEDLITHRLPLNDAAAGFALLLQGDASMKVIINPQAA
jgi:L-iditol 2-dehydrogenase